MQDEVVGQQTKRRRGGGAADEEVEAGRLAKGTANANKAAATTKKTRGAEAAAEESVTGAGAPGWPPRASLPESETGILTAALLEQCVVSPFSVCSLL